MTSEDIKHQLINPPLLQMMRNIFIKCFNTCRTPAESELSETWALRNMKFSPRLFDIKLFQRRETVAYFEDADMFVLAEGEAARCYNFQTGRSAERSKKNRPNNINEGETRSL